MDISKEFETTLLKNIISNHNFFGKIFHLLKEKYFTNLGNKNIFKIISEYYSEYRSVPTFIEIITKCKDVPNAELRKEIANSLNKIKESDVIHNDEFLCKETVSFIKDSIYLEALLIGSDALQKKSDNLKIKAQTLFEEMTKVSIDETLGLNFDDVDEMIKHFSERNFGIKTQHRELNKRLGAGFLPGTLSTICAAQGVGKSLLMCDLISGNIQNNKNVLMISLEMSDYEMMKRVYANVFDIDANSFSDLSKTEGELKNINHITKDDILNKYTKYQMTGTCGKLFIKDYPSGTFSASMLENLVEKFREQKNITFDIIYVDYLGIAKSDRVHPSQGSYIYLKSISEEFRASAKNLNVPIISAAQLQRSAINQTDEIDNSKLSDSVGTAMTADFMCFILQNEQMKEESKVILKVTKNRFTGITDTWCMDIDYPKMRFMDCLTENGSTFRSNAEKTNAEQFAKSEIKKAQQNDINVMRKMEKSQITDDINDILEGLGL